LDEKVEEFLNKPVEKEIPYLFVDASYYKVRDEVAGRYKTKALLTVVGIRSFPTLHWKRIKTTIVSYIALEKDKNDEHIGEGEQRTEKTQQSSRSISK